MQFVLLLLESWIILVNTNVCCFFNSVYFTTQQEVVEFFGKISNVMLGSF